MYSPVIVCTLYIGSLVLLLSKELEVTEMRDEMILRHGSVMADVMVAQVHLDRCCSSASPQKYCKLKRKSLSSLEELGSSQHTRICLHLRTKLVRGVNVN
jgi:hypothetical protein